MGIRTATPSERAADRLSPRLLDAAREALVAIDPAGNVTYANTAAERMCGWGAGEAPTRRMAAGIVPEESVAVARELVERAHDGDVWSGRVALQRRDGSPFRVDATAVPVIVDGELTNILIAASDVSEQEPADERVAQSKSLLQEAQRLAHVGHWRWHVGSDHLEWLSDELYAIHGVPRGWVGTFDAYLELVPRDDHRAVNDAGEEVLRAGSADVVHRIVRPDGVIRHVRNRSEAVFGADGTPVVVFGTCQDVTDHVTMSAALGKRLKELTCLVTVGQVLHDLDDPAWVYASVGAGLVLALQHPERAIAVIDIEDRQHSTATVAGPHDTSHLVAAPILIRGQERGRIHVGYSDGGDDILPEERALLAAVASMIALWMERRESAAELTQTESRFRRLVHNVPDVVFRFRLGDGGGFEYVSPAVETLTGYRPHEFLADPQLVERLLGGSSDPERSSHGADADGIASGLAHVIRRDGALRWVEYNLVGVSGERGDVIAVEGVARDVTDRVVAANAAKARALEQSVLARISEAAVTAPGLDELFETAARLVVETLPVEASSITELRNDGDEMFVRGGFGWRDGVVGVATFPVAGSLAERTLGSDTPIVVADIGPDAAVASPFLAAHGVASGMAVRISGKEGTFGALGAFSTAPGSYSTHHAAFMQTVAHILAAAVDRWRAEAALASRERHFRTLTESLPDIVGRVDQTYRHLYVNPAVECVGVAAEDLLGKTFRETGLPPHLADVLERAVDEVFDSGHQMSVEFDLPRPDGHRHLQSLVIPEFNDDGSVTTVIAVTRDITALRRAEELRREGLSRIVAAQEEERGRIGEDIHDDSIQVMAAVGMRLEGLRRQIDDPEAMLMLDRLEEVVRHSVSRLRALMFELRPPELDREGVVTALRLYVQATAAEGTPSCDVVDEWRSDLPVEARNVLYRVALEAISNARKHAHASRIEVMFDAAEGGIRMRIRDDGSGFDLGTLADVGPHHVGTTTMRERMEAAGGALDIQSARGAGTVVAALLPATRELTKDAA